MKLKRISTHLLILTFLLLFMPSVVVHAGDAFSPSSGNGTSSNPYVFESILNGGNSQLIINRASGSYTYFILPMESSYVTAFTYIGTEAECSTLEYYNKAYQEFRLYKTDYKNGTDTSLALAGGSGATYMFRIPNNAPNSDINCYTSNPVAKTAGSTENITLNTLIIRKQTSKVTYHLEAEKSGYMMINYGKLDGSSNTLPVGTQYKRNGYGPYNLTVSYLWMDAGASYDIILPYVDSKSYYLSLVYREFDYGTVKVTWSNNYNDFTATLTPGNNPDGATATLSDWDWPYDSKDNHGSLSGTKGSGHIIHYFDNVGYATLRIKVRGNGSYKWINASTLTIPPAVPTASLSNVTRTGAIINLSLVNKASHGDRLAVQKLVGGTWQTIQTVPITSNLSKINISGLKAKTSYTMRVVGMKDAANGYSALTGSGRNFTFKTGLSTKPAVKSVKVSKVKVKKVPRRFIMGHWIGSGSNRRYLSGYYVGGYVTTSYKVTVTLKTPARGSKGLWIDGVFVKGTGKKFTANLSMNAKSSMKGKKKKITICSAMDKNYGGLSPSVTKNVKLK